MVVFDIPFNPVWKVVDNLQSWIDLQLERKPVLGPFWDRFAQKVSSEKLGWKLSDKGEN